MARIIAIDPQSTFDYVIKSQQEDEHDEQTRWQLRHLSAKDEAFIEDKLGYSQEGKFHISIGSQNLLALEVGLAGVENFCDKNGDEVPLVLTGKKKHGRYKEIEPTFIDKIPKAVRQELAEAILNAGVVKEEDLKN